MVCGKRVGTMLTVLIAALAWAEAGEAHAKAADDRAKNVIIS